MTVSDLLWHGLATTFWVSILTILVLGLRRPVAERWGARVAMLLWMIPAVRLFLPTLPRVVSVPAQPAQESAAAMPVLTEGAVDDPSMEDQPAPWAPPSPIMEEGAVSSSPAMPISGLPAETMVTPDPASFISLPMTEVLAAIVLSIWFGGVIVSLGLCWIGARRWRMTVIAEAKPSPAALSRLVERVKKRARVDHSFAVVVSAAADTPQLLGLRRPMIALPSDFFDRLDPDEQEMALLHELVHLKRRDLIIMAVTELAAALQWFNPLNGHVRRAVRDDQEAACDETVRSFGVSRQRYAALLVKAASNAPAVPALTLDHGLKDRIILMTAPVGSPTIRGAAALAAIAGSVSLAAATASYTDVPIPASMDERRSEGRLRDMDVDRQWPFDNQGPDSTAASYWEMYRSSSRDDHLYTPYSESGPWPPEPRTPERPPTPSAGQASVAAWTENSAMILLSDPFAAITPPADLALAMPTIPEPPVPAVQERRVEGGRWIFVPDEPDTVAFDEAIEDFEQRMEAWADKLEGFNERSRAATNAVDGLAAQCDRHRRGSDAPAILDQPIKGTDEVVRAVCATGGMARYRSAEMALFIDNQVLTEAEVDHFRRSLRTRG
ncbi:MAG: M56 family metallopeptidase [Pseudomonadota bacterium]